MRSAEGYVKELRKEVQGERSSAFLVVLFPDEQYDIVQSDDADPFALLNGMMALRGVPVIVGQLTDEDGIWALSFRILPEYADNEFVQALGNAMMEAANQISQHNLEAALKNIANASRDR